MKCIYCNCTESRVVDSRPTEDGAIRRRRECEECKRRFTTYEKIEMLPVLVVNGAHDVMINSYATYAMSQQLPDAKVVLYSDAGHGFLFQHIADFAHDVNRFLG